MSQSNIVIEQATIQQFEERKRLRQALEDARQKASTLEQFTSQISEHGNTSQLSPLTSEASPPAELQATLPALERSVAEIHNIEKMIHEQYDAIEEIQRRARNMKYMLIGGGVVLIFILLLLILHVV